jgi:hypothetical protein
MLSPQKMLARVSWGIAVYLAMVTALAIDAIVVGLTASVDTGSGSFTILQNGTITPKLEGRITRIDN